MTSSLFDSFSLYIGHPTPADLTEPASDDHASDGHAAGSEQARPEVINVDTHSAVEPIHVEHVLPSHHFDV